MAGSYSLAVGTDCNIQTLVASRFADCRMRPSSGCTELALVVAADCNTPFRCHLQPA